jgi:plastocyanin
MRVVIFLWLIIVSTGTFSKEHVVEVYKKKFSPVEITIEQGDTVIWRNIEKRQYHSVWFKQLDKEEPDYFFPNESYQKQFKNSGEFPYECGPHPRMKGKVIVTDKTN